MIRVPRVSRSRSFGFLAAVAVASGIFIVGCEKDALITAPKTLTNGASLDVSGTTGSTIVISQVYGGGGNSGATLKNDFIEIHNRSSAAVDLSGWSVQYASAAGSFSAANLTALSGTIGAGQYLLIQEAAGAGGSVNLPTPNFSGNIAMSATAAKVALVSSTAPLPCSGSLTSCTSPQLVDFVGYGTANGFEGTAAAPGLSNTTADARLQNGCKDTNDNAADFASGAPAPRNSATTPLTCDLTPPGAIDHITVSPGDVSIAVGATQTFTAAAFDASNQPVAATFAWSLNPASSTVANVDGTTGVATALAVGDVGIVATANGKSGSGTLHVAPAVSLPETRFTEIHYDNSGDDVDEQIEIEGPAQTDLSDWSIVLYDGTSKKLYDSKPLTGLTIPATCGDRGVVVVPFTTIQNGNPDGFALVHNTEVVQFLSYEGTFTATDGPAAGLTSTDIGVAELSNSSDISSLQLDGMSGKWTGPSRRTFGRCNKDGPLPFDITFSGRQPISDPPLPVSFEDQLCATMVDLTGTAVATTFTWSSDTPAVASIDQKGVMHSLAAGQAIFRATSANGTTATFKLPTTIATLGGTADYRGNTAFGIPTDADGSDDFIITRDQYTISYSHSRNTPNWVSYEFDATHFAPNGTTVDRCDCFTHDPALPGSFTHLTTADYTGAGAFAGYGIDRGHMARSFDFTSGTLDNALSYYLSNIIPQAAAVNQGPWKILEDTLGNLARFHDNEVYVVDGVAGSKGTVKGEGKIVIPASVWKVALVLPRDHGLADIHDYRDIDEVIAVIMPNDPNVNTDWTTYKTTVDEVERISGYNLLSLLPDKTERAIESNTRPPVAVLDGPYASSEGGSFSLNASGSFDGGGTIVDYSWSFGDGATAIGQSATHTYAQDGIYIVRLIVTDNLGVADTSYSTAAVANVAPSIAPFAGATLLPGETYSANGSFSDPGADPWSATVNYGDGSSTELLPLTGKTFALAHTYMMPGTFTVTVRVSDDDVTSARTQFVTVISPAQALSQAAGMIGELVDNAGLNSGNANSLRTKLNAAQNQLAAGNATAAANQLQALLNEVDAMIRSGRISRADAEALVTMVNRVIRSISL